MQTVHVFTRKQEYANAASHALGVGFSVVALVLLIVYSVSRGTVWDVVSFAVFGSTMLLLYTCSTLLHSLPQGRAKNVFEILDHAAIYLFIAGTYTPILLMVVKGWEGWALFWTVWAIALAGVVFKVFFVKRFMILSTVGYLLLGWMVVLVLGPLAHNLPLPGLLYLFGGGVFYTVGTVFYVWKRITYHHALWHLFVLAGSACHFIMVLVYLLPVR